MTDSLLTSSILVRPAKPRVSGIAGGTPGPEARVRYAKLAQIVNGELRCFEFDLPSGTPGGVLAGDDLQTFAPIDQVIWPESSDYLCNGQPPVPAPQVGDMLEILSGPDAGTYAMLSFIDCRQAQLDSDMTSTSGGFNLPWQIQVADQPPDPNAPLVPNYSKVIKARAVPGSPLHRYRPYLGPGDHIGSDLVTTDGSATVTSAGASFIGDESNPVVPGMYIEITGGADNGRHLINNVVSDTELELAAPMTADETGLSYRIDIVSEHATTLQLVPAAGGQLIAVPDAHSVEVKIARAIRDEDDAVNLDTFRELGTTEALDLFNEHGAYLACYRLQVGASHAQGLPIDDRVIIAAMPWRGHLVNSVLFFDDQDPAESKYDLTDANEPVWPIRWFNVVWRVEIAIARATRQEPTEEETCT